MKTLKTVKQYCLVTFTTQKMIFLRISGGKKQIELQLTIIFA